MFFYYALDGVQTQSCALAYSLGGEEGFENAGLDVGRNSRTGVADLHYNTTVIAIGSNSKVAGSVHGVDGVVDDVGPDLIEFTAERIHQQRRGLIVAFDDHSFFQFVVEDSQSGFEAFTMSTLWTGAWSM